MLISGNKIPVIAANNGYAAFQHQAQSQRTSLERYPDADAHNRQQTVEYIFRGEFDEDFHANRQKQAGYQQSIDPANQGAIYSYHDNQTVSAQRPERQGSLVDIFI